MRPNLALPLMFLLVLPACSARMGADYPALVPIEELAARAEGITITPATESGLEARAEALRARAATLRGEVLTPRERSRLNIR